MAMRLGRVTEKSLGASLLYPRISDGTVIVTGARKFDIS
jgi:hypothetical protein